MKELGGTLSFVIIFIIVWVVIAGPVKVADQLNQAYQHLV